MFIPRYCIKHLRGHDKVSSLFNLSQRKCHTCKDISSPRIDADKYLASEWLNLWKMRKNFIWTVWSKKLYHPDWGDPQWEKIFFFSILGIRMAQFAKRKQKNISNILTQKNSITPAGMTSNGQKSPKIFFLHFWHQNDSIRKKKQIKIFDPKFGPGMCGMWPKKGSKWFTG